MHLRLRPHFALLWIVALLPLGLGSAVKAQSTTICQNLGSGIVTCRERPDPLKQLQDTVEDIVADRNAKRQREAEAAYRASQLAQQQELIRLQIQAEEAERARVAATWRQQSNVQSRQDAERRADQLLRSQVSTAVLDGRCEDAKTIALQASRIDMAEQALRICTPKKVQPAVKTPKSSAAPHSAPQQAFAKQSTPNITTPVELPFDETLIVAVKERRIDCALALNAVRKTGDQGQEFRVQQFCASH